MVSNQKRIKVIKEPVSKERKYMMIDMTTLNNAMADLTPEGFVLWIYFAKNSPGYEFSLSSKHCIENTKLTEYKYNKAIKELTDKQYLKPTKEIYPHGKQQIYLFCENPNHVIDPREFSF